MITAYIADTSTLADEKLFSRLYGLVSDERRRKIDRMRFAKDKYLSLGVELLLMRACADFGVDYAKQRILYDEYQKPHFAEGGVHFNLSHSDDRVMCVMAENCVGCDVEHITDIDLDIAKNFFFKEEYATIAKRRTRPEMNDTFFRLWTLKESFMKCTGLGFRLPLNAFSVSIDGSEVTVCQSVDDARYRFFEYDANDDYKYAVCLRYVERINNMPDDDVQWKHVGFDGEFVP